MADLLKNGTAVVTGAASGIGRATAIAFARDGCKRLGLFDVSIAGLEETRSLVIESYPSIEVEIAQLDVSSEEQVDKVYGEFSAQFGRIDYAANVAGVQQASCPIEEISSETFDRNYAVSQKGLFLCERAELRQMLQQDRDPETKIAGSIVNVTSMLATSPLMGMSAYSTIKAGARGLSRSDALDYGPDGIRVNMVAPSIVKSPVLLQSQGEAFADSVKAQTPLRRIATPEDIANAIVWLSSPRASFITGVSLLVDGGLALETGP